MKVLLLSYFHNEPIMYVLERYSKRRGIHVDIMRVNPATCKDSILKESFDLALVPSSLVEQACSMGYKITDVVIACRDSLRSVRVFYTRSVPVDKLRDIYSTRESIVSRRLLVSLLRMHGLVDLMVRCIEVSLQNMDLILSTKPTLLIGDLALVASSRYRTVIDLCELWLSLYKVPLVFAVLLVRTTCDSKRSEMIEDVVETLRRELVQGSLNVDDVLSWSRHWIKRHVNRDVLRNYLSNEIIYVMKKEEVAASLSLIKQALAQAPPLD